MLNPGGTQILGGAKLFGAAGKWGAAKSSGSARAFGCRVKARRKYLKMAEKTVMLSPPPQSRALPPGDEPLTQEDIMAEEMASAGKLAKEWGVSDAAVKKAIKELGIEPDAKKGVCAMYSKATADKIKKALK